MRATPLKGSSLSLSIPFLFTDSFILKWYTARCCFAALQKS